MKKIEITAKTVQKAIEQGLKELNVTQDQVDIKIIDEGGFFKKAKVEKEEKVNKEEVKEVNMIDYGTNFLKGLFEKMNVEAEITSFEADGCVTFNASGEKVSTLIGKRGETLNAIQDILANVMKNANFRDKKFYFDVENYKNRREISLINLAERMAKKALKIEKPIKLERMNAYERKIIHTALQSCEGITTKSEGEEPNRHLVIIPTKKDEE